MQNLFCPIEFRLTDQHHQKAQQQDPDCQQKQGEPHVVDRIVGVRIIMDLPKEGHNKLYQCRKQEQGKQYADRHRMAVGSVPDHHQQHSSDKKRLYQHIPQFRLFISRVKSHTHPVSLRLSEISAVPLAIPLACPVRYRPAEPSCSFRDNHCLR